MSGTVEEVGIAQRGQAVELKYSKEILQLACAPRQRRPKHHHRKRHHRCRHGPEPMFGGGAPCRSPTSVVRTAFLTSTTFGRLRHHRRVTGEFTQWSPTPTLETTPMPAYAPTQHIDKPYHATNITTTVGRANGDSCQHHRYCHNVLRLRPHQPTHEHQRHRQQHHPCTSSAKPPSHPGCGARQP